MPSDLLLVLYVIFFFPVDNSLTAVAGDRIICHMFQQMTMVKCVVLRFPITLCLFTLETGKKE